MPAEFTARAAAVYLASKHCPRGERHNLCRSANPLNVQFAVLPDPQTADLAVYIREDLRAVRVHTRLIMSTDGILRGQSASGGVVFPRMAGAQVVRASFGLRVWASPTNVESLARLVAISLLQGWSGAVLCTNEAAATLFLSHTTSPPRYTVLEAL